MGHLADAPTIGTGNPDASTTTGGPPPPVTLTVTHNGAPVQGVHTYFLNPDNTVSATMDTDANGQVTAALPDGGTVTALDPFPNIVADTLRLVADIAINSGENELRTFAGVKPGDKLVLDRTDSETEVSIVVPQAPEFGSSYQVYTPCGSGQIFGNQGSGGPPTAFVDLVGCPATFDVAVVAISPDAGAGGPSQVLIHKAATITNGTIDLSADDDTYAAATKVSYTISNPPGSPITAQHTLVTAGGSYGPFTADATGGTATIQEPSFANETAISDVEIDMTGQHHIIDAAAFAATITIDPSSVLLADFDSFLNDNGDGRVIAFNPTNKQVSWLESTDGVAADLSTSTIDVSRGESSWNWTIVAPYSAGVIKFPTLPVDANSFDFNPAVDDNISVDTVINAKVPGGYDAVRAKALDAIDLVQDGTNFAALGAALGATGRVVAVQATTQALPKEPQPTAHTSKLAHVRGSTAPAVHATARSIRLAKSVKR